MPKSGSFVDSEEKGDDELMSLLMSLFGCNDFNGLLGKKGQKGHKRDTKGTVEFICPFCPFYL